MRASDRINGAGRAGLFAASLALALAGCGGDGGGGGPAPTATATATVTATSSSTATLTATPSLSPTRTFTPSPTPTATNTLTPIPTLPFAVHGSIEQLYIADAPPGLSVTLLDANDAVVREATTDAQGALVLRDLAVGDGYRIRADIDGKTLDSAPVRVTAFDEPAPESFYASQQINAGYGYLTTRDGTKLAINVVVPAGKTLEDGPFPTVVEYSGYDPSNPDAPQPSTLIASNIDYVAVGVNIRGTGCSGGSFLYFERPQSTDGYDVIEIIAAQPWVKNHKVGMVGISYPGISQLFVAQTQPPHLAAIAPLSIIADSARGNLTPGGILNNGFSLEWISERQREAMPFGQGYAAKRRDQGDQVCIENQRLRGQNADMVQLINDNKFYVPELLDHLTPALFVDKINVPVFLAGAWQDEQTGGYFPTMLDRFTGTDKLHFTMTNGQHVDSLGDPAIFTRWLEFLSFYVREEVPTRPFTANGALQILAQEIFGVRRLTPEPERFNSSMTYEEALAIWESEKKVRVLFENGAGTPAEPGAPVPTMDLSFDSWPIPEVQPATFYLAKNGVLQATAPSGDRSDSYNYDPSRAQQVTYDGGESVWKALPAYDWPTPETGKALSYMTEALDHNLVMAGSGSVDLWFQSTAADTDVQVTLTEVRPDGKEFYIQSGWLRASFRKVDEGQSTVLRPFHRGEEEDIAPLPGGEFSLMRVELFPFAHIFRIGSRIRLIVDAPGASRVAWKFDALQPDGPTVNTVAYSVALPSHIVLPVIPNITVTKPYPPCPSLRGQPCRTYEELTNTTDSL